MNYIPDGSAGALQLDFDYQQFYSYYDDYSWFRVTVDGVVLTEGNSGEQCLRSAEAFGSGWSHLHYDLSAYQTPGQNFDLVIDFVGKYSYLYYQGGDAAMIDNVQLRYVADTRTIQNQTINNGQTECFDATNTITVAGSGTTVDILSGGQAIFIAGQKIFYKPGFTAHSGSYCHGYITESGNYCSQQPPLVAAQDPEEEEIREEDVVIVEELLIDKDVVVYPNPTPGMFTIDFIDIATTADILLMNFLGNLVHETSCENQNKKTIDIGHLPAGMYMIVIKSNNQVITKRIVKND